MKTLWIEDEDALNVGRVIVTKTGTKDCVVCYSCDEIDDYENRLNADMVAMLKDLKADIDIMSDTVVEGRTVTITSWKGMQERISNLIQSKIDKLKENSNETNKSDK